MYCTRCGAELTASARFCSQCGERAAAAGPEASPRQAPRRLYRLTYDKKIAGICSGIARYIDVDVTLVRVIAVAVTLFTGLFPGVIAYLVAMFIMPRDEPYLPSAPHRQTPPAEMPRDSTESSPGVA
ncbi:MAG: PspC domain-containing protein [Bryobacteraceae bacterium]